MTVTDPAVLATLPVGTVIKDHGLLAAKAPSGAWVYGDGECWEPQLPVELIGTSDS